MKTLATVLILVLACAPALGQVLDPPENLLTLKPNPFSSAHDFDCWRVLEGDILTLQLAVFNPVNPDYMGLGEARPVENVNGFQCKIVGTPGAFIVARRYPVPTIDLGEGGMDASFQIPVPVVEGRIVLLEVDFIIAYPDFELPVYETGPCYLEANIEVDIVPYAYSAIPGRTVYYDADDTVNSVISCLDTPDDYDFRLLLTQGPVATDGHTWGTMKALYR